MIHLVALLTAKPGQREALLAEFRQVMPKVHAEDGCIEYQPAIDAAGFDKVTTALGPDSFAVIEKWASAEALRAHMKAPHMADYAARTRDMIASRVLHILTGA